MDPDATGPEPVDREALFREHLGEGFRRWNAHRFFDCHEALEDAWRLVKHEKKREPARDPRRDLVQGVLLLAVAYHHWREGNLVGARRKRDEALAMVRGRSGTLDALDVHHFVAACKADLDRLETGGSFDARRVPTLPI